MSVLGEIRDKIQIDKKTLLESVAAEKKRLLQMVVGYDNDVDVDILAGSSDASNRGCVGLAAGQQTLVKAAAGQQTAAG